MPFWSFNNCNNCVNDSFKHGQDSEAEEILNPEEESDDEFDVENDGHWDPDEDPVEDWPDNVEPDPHFNHSEPFKNWDNDVKPEPFWNEVHDHANLSS